MAKKIHGVVTLRKELLDSSLYFALKEHLSIQFQPARKGSDEFIDIWVGEGIAIQWLSEQDLVQFSPISDKRLKSLQQTSRKPVVLCEYNTVSERYLPQIQDIVVFHMGMLLITVDSPQNAAVYIKNLVQLHHQQGNSPVSSCHLPSHSTILQTVQCLPQTGPMKGKTLLRNFGCIRHIAAASHEDLINTLGTTTANQVYSYLHSK